MSDEMKDTTDRTTAHQPSREVDPDVHVWEWLRYATNLFPDKQQIAFLPVVAADPQTAAESLAALVPRPGGAGRHVHFVNAYTIALASADPALREVLCDEALNFPDGRPLQWVSSLAGHAPRIQQVRGPRFFEDSIAHGRIAGLKHYLLGSTPEVLEKLTSRLETKFPGVQIVGVESPPFRALTEQEYAEQDTRILRSDAEVVWVGLGTPKQDFEARRLAQALPVVALAVGAAFDFSAGTLKEAPTWMRGVGLEWLYRLVREPRRLWRRYLFGNVRFVRVGVTGAVRERARSRR